MEKVHCSVSEILYGFYFAFLFGSKAWGIHEGFSVYKYVLLAGVLLYFVKELCTEKTVGEHLVSVLLLGIASVTYLCSGEKGLLLYFTMMLGMKNVSLRFIQGLALGILGISFPLMYLVSTTELAWTVPGQFYRIFMGIVLRYDWGYPGPNVTHTTLIVLLALLIANITVKTTKQLITFAGMLLLCAIYVYMYTVSYTGMIGCIVLLFSYVYLNCRKSLCTFEKWGITLLYPVIGSVSVGLPMLVSEDVFWQLDKIFHNRINYSRYFLTSEPITLFGTRLGETPIADYYIDSAYIYSFLQIGVIPCIVVTGLFVWYTMDCLKEDRRNELAVAISFAVIGLSDPFLYNLGYKNIMFIWYGVLLYKKLGKIKWLNNGVLGRKVSTPLTEIGSRQIVFKGRLVDAFYSAKAKVKNHFCEYGAWDLVWFCSAFAFFLWILMKAVGMSKMDGRIDTPDEWNLFHVYMNHAIALSIVLVFITDVLHVKDKFRKGRRFEQ